MAQPSPQHSHALALAQGPRNFHRSWLQEPSLGFLLSNANRLSLTLPRRDTGLMVRLPGRAREAGSGTRAQRWGWGRQELGGQEPQLTTALPWTWVYACFLDLVSLQNHQSWEQEKKFSTVLRRVPCGPCFPESQLSEKPVWGTRPHAHPTRCPGLTWRWVWKEA